VNENPKLSIDNINVREQDELDDSSDGSDIGADRDNDDDKLVAQQRLKTRAQQDWNYLKQTLGSKSRKHEQDNSWGDKNNKFPSSEHNHISSSNHGSGGSGDDEENDGDMMELQEKADTVLEKEEELISQHMHLIKENA
jgi:hypothetical protein